jgi:hypothetical protein
MANSRHTWIQPLLTASCRSLVLIACVSLPVDESAAMWARMSEQELRERSDLIVTGVLIGKTRVRIGSADLTLGVIEVRETLQGEPATVALLVLPSPGQPVASDTVQHAIGADGLWYLRLRIAAEPGLYVADHPQRFVPMTEAGPAIAALRRLKKGAGP